MDDIIKRFCPRYDFDSYEDMKQNFKINVPDDFNFGFDVVDAWADIEPEKLALVWTNDAGDMARYTFKDIKDNSKDKGRRVIFNTRKKDRINQITKCKRRKKFS